MDINRNNYESFFLTYLDGELMQTDKESVEKFLSENTDLQKEFSTLKSMRLVPDEYYFDNKQMLLRTEEKRRVLPVFWLRIAAALMLGIGGAWVVGNLKIRKLEKLEMGRSEKDESIVNNLKIREFEKEEIGGNEKMRKLEKLKIQGNEKDAGIAGSGKDVKIRKFENLKMEGINKNEKIGKFEKEEIETVESKEVIADIQKTAINIQPETAMPNPVIDTRGISTPEMKMSPLVAISATVPENNSNATSIASQSSDQSEDVSISVLSVSGKNKPVAGFFKKLLNNKSSDKSGRTVNVSVLQISY